MDPSDIPYSDDIFVPIDIEDDSAFWEEERDRRPKKFLVRYNATGIVFLPARLCSKIEVLALITG